MQPVQSVENATRPDSVCQLSGAVLRRGSKTLSGLQFLQEFTAEVVEPGPDSVEIRPGGRHLLMMRGPAGEKPSLYYFAGADLIVKEGRCSVRLQTESVRLVPDHLEFMPFTSGVVDGPTGPDFRRRNFIPHQEALYDQLCERAQVARGLWSRVGSRARAAPCPFARWLVLGRGQREGAGR